MPAHDGGGAQPNGRDALANPDVVLMKDAEWLFATNSNPTRRYRRRIQTQPLAQPPDSKASNARWQTGRLPNPFVNACKDDALLDLRFQQQRRRQQQQQDPGTAIAPLRSNWSWSPTSGSSQSPSRSPGGTKAHGWGGVCGKDDSGSRTAPFGTDPDAPQQPHSARRAGEQQQRQATAPTAAVVIEPGHGVQRPPKRTTRAQARVAQHQVAAASQGDPPSLLPATSGAAALAPAPAAPNAPTGGPPMQARPPPKPRTRGSPLQPARTSHLFPALPGTIAQGAGTPRPHAAAVVSWNPTATAAAATTTTTTIEAVTTTSSSSSSTAPTTNNNTAAAATTTTAAVTITTATAAVPEHSGSVDACAASSALQQPGTPAIEKGSQPTDCEGGTATAAADTGAAAAAATAAAAAAAAADALVGLCRPPLGVGDTHRLQLTDLVQQHQQRESCSSGDEVRIERARADAALHRLHEVAAAVAAATTSAALSRGRNQAPCVHCDEAAASDTNDTAANARLEGCGGGCRGAAAADGTETEAADAQQAKTHRLQSTAPPAQPLLCVGGSPNEQPKVHRPFHGDGDSDVGAGGGGGAEDLGSIAAAKAQPRWLLHGEDDCQPDDHRQQQQQHHYQHQQQQHQHQQHQQQQHQQQQQDSNNRDCDGMPGAAARVEVHPTPAHVETKEVATSAAAQTAAAYVPCVKKPRGIKVFQGTSADNTLAITTAGDDDKNLVVNKQVEAVAASTATVRQAADAGRRRKRRSLSQTSTSAADVVRPKKPRGIKVHIASAQSPTATTTSTTTTTTTATTTTSVPRPEARQDSSIDQQHTQAAWELAQAEIAAVADNPTMRRWLAQTSAAETTTTPTPHDGNDHRRVRAGASLPLFPVCSCSMQARVRCSTRDQSVCAHRPFFDANCSRRMRRGPKPTAHKAPATQRAAALSLQEAPQAAASQTAAAAVAQAKTKKKNNPHLTRNKKAKNNNAARHHAGNAHIANIVFGPARNSAYKPLLFLPARPEVVAPRLHFASVAAADSEFSEPASSTSTSNNGASSGDTKASTNTATSSFSASGSSSNDNASNNTSGELLAPTVK
jgi:hypothetical protein